MISHLCKFLVGLLVEIAREEAWEVTLQYHRHAKQLIRERLAAKKGGGTASMLRAYMRMRERGPLS